MSNTINIMQFQALNEQNAYLNYAISRALEIESIKLDVKYNVEQVDDDTLSAMIDVANALTELTEMPYLKRLIAQAKEEDFTLLL